MIWLCHAVFYNIGVSSCEKSTSISTFTGNSVLCGGQSSCYNIDEDIVSSNVFCSAKWSCLSSTIEASNTYCTGEASCSDSIINIADDGLVDCSGKGSCYSAMISSPGKSATVTLQFTGFESFAYTAIECKKSDICNILTFTRTLINQDTDIVCDGQCNVVCPEEFGCPSFVHVFIFVVSYFVSSKPTTNNIKPFMMALFISVASYVFSL